VRPGRLLVLVVGLSVVITACRTSPPDTPPSPTDTPTATTGGTTAVQVFLAHPDRGDPCEEVFPVTREVASADPLRGALEALLAGPTATERAEGFEGWFSADTDGLLEDVRVEDRRALVSFDAMLPSRIPNASSSCGSTLLLAQLDHTVTQFPEVDEGWYGLAGDRAEFYGWLQRAAPDDHTPTPEPTPSTPSPTTTTTPSPTATPSPTPSAPPHDDDLGVEWSVLPGAPRSVALTFDAGANADAVASIRETLTSTGVPATFFLTGRWVTAYPGHAASLGGSYTIGNHSQRHLDLTRETDEVVVAEITDAEEVIAAATTTDPHPWFRFPYGARDARTLAIAADLGYRSVRWTVDTLGWQGTTGGMSADRVVQRVMDALQPGAIVLMHVGSHPTDGSTLDADALPEMIERIRAAGYGFVTLDDAA
jgi:peptidoglycan-N-acetylglucosamine deacetylase